MVSEAETVLGPGDLMLVTVNADGGDAFDFVPLVDLEAGTVIRFTDAAWTGSGLEDAEGIVIYTVPVEGVSSGQVVHYPGTSTAEFARSGYFSISAAGDTLLVYQGLPEAPQFVLGVGWARGASVWEYNGTSNTSDIPPGLSLQDHTVVSLGTSDNYQYDPAAGLSGTPAQLLALAADPGNYFASDAAEFPRLDVVFEVHSGDVTTPAYGFSGRVLPWPGRGQLILWVCLFEDGVARYEIERSVAREAWEWLGEHPADGRAKLYVWEDPGGLEDDLYRVTAVDVSGFRRGYLLSAACDAAAAQEGESVLHIEPGWNLVSVPLFTLRSGLLQDLVVGPVWRWSGGGYEEVSRTGELDGRHGYWFYSDRSWDLVIPGI
jgi:hypothetical protein